MPDDLALTQRPAAIRNVAIYHQDTDASHRLFFSIDNPEFAVRFVGYSLSQVEAELLERLNETDLRSSFAILSRLEAAFRIDYAQRCKRRKRDAVSKAFRALYKTQGVRVRLEDDILETWRQERPEMNQLISELRGAFGFRHWLAHGMYWLPKFGRKYDYQWIYTLADGVFAVFPLYEQP